MFTQLKSFGDSTITQLKSLQLKSLKPLAPLLARAHPCALPVVCARNVDAQITERARERERKRESAGATERESARARERERERERKRKREPKKTDGEAKTSTETKAVHTAVRLLYNDTKLN